MFEVEVINACDENEKWSWDTLGELLSDYEDADILALPNDFDRVVKASIDGEEIDVNNFGEFVEYAKTMNLEV